MLARAAIAVTLGAALGAGASLGACTSGATPDCEGGVCGYGIAEGGPEEAGEAAADGSTPADTGSPPVDATGQ